MTKINAKQCCREKRPFKSSILLLFGISLTLSPAFAEAQEFDIDAGPAVAALSEFAAQADVSVVYTYDAVEGIETNEVEGTYEPDQALQLMLGGTGLSVFEGDGGAFAVSAEEKEGGDSDSKKARSMPLLMAQNQTSAARNQTSTAQTPVPEKKKDDDDAIVRMEEIIITGSRIRGAQSAAPVITITRDDIAQAGFATVDQLVDSLPQNFSAGATLDGSNSTNKAQTVGGGIAEVGNFAGGLSVNLRGMGTDSTLILLNGRRMSPSGAFGGFTNIAAIPMTAIERVEVMTDGASAIYGSDAIGGVINFILKEDYDGAETVLRYGTATDGSISNVRFGQSFGSTWDSGNAILSYEYYDSEPLAATDRDFTASNDLSPFGGTDWRLPGGNPANIIAGGQSYAIPAGQDGTSLTAADFIGLENTQNFFNDKEGTHTVPGVERHAVFLHMRQAVGPVELFGAARFSGQETNAKSTNSWFSFTVQGDDPATPEIEGSPFFVDPTGTGLTEVRVENYLLVDEFPQKINRGEIESYGATLGAQFSFSENWQGELVGNWSKEVTNQWILNGVDFTALRGGAVNETDPLLAFNPFGDGSNTAPAGLAAVTIPKSFAGRSKNDVRSIGFNIDGELFDIGGGAVKVATGLDFREESLYSLSSVPTTSDFSRDIAAVYAEVFMPFVSDANKRTGLQQLEVSLAARYEDYSDFGSDLNPKMGILWSPIESLAIRGTIGTSYRAPSLREMDQSGNVVSYFPEGLFGLSRSVLLAGGSRDDLDPEEATTWTAGFQWRTDKLSLDVTYFSVDFTGRIEKPASVSLFALVDDPRYASIRVENPTTGPDGEIAPFANNPAYLPDRLVDFGAGPFSAADLISGAIPVAVMIDNRLTNLTTSEATGLEVQLSYLFDTNLGSINVGLNSSYMFDFKRQLLQSEPVVDEVDTIGRPVDFRARGSVSWNRDSWTVSGFVSYTDGYTDNFSDPEREVGSWATLDLTVAYRTANGTGILSDTRVALSVSNALNEDPPFVNTIGGVGYDATQASPLGRMAALNITKEW